MNKYLYIWAREKHIELVYVKNNDDAIACINEKNGNVIIVACDYLKYDIDYLELAGYINKKELPIVIIPIIENTDKEFIKLIDDAVNWITRTIDFSSLSGKVIMKNNTGIGVCLRNLCHLLPEDSYYIATDNNIEFLKNIKRIMEQKKRKPKLIFSCSEFNDLPIADKSVDLIIDKISGSSYDLNKVGFTMSLLRDKLKDSGRWIGTYLHFPTNAIPKALKKEMIPYFTLHRIKKAFQQDYVEIDSKDFGNITMEVGEYGSFLNKDDKVYQWTYYGEKIKT